MIEFKFDEPVQGDEFEARVFITHRHDHGVESDGGRAPSGHLSHRLVSKAVTGGDQIIFTARETSRIMPNDHLRIELSRCRHERQVNGHDREGGRIDSEIRCGAI